MQNLVTSFDLDSQISPVNFVGSYLIQYFILFFFNAPNFIYYKEMQSMSYKYLRAILVLCNMSEYENENEYEHLTQF